MTAAKRTPSSRGCWVSRTVRAVAAALAAPEARERILGMGQDPIGNTPEEFDALFKAELVRFAKVIEQAKIQRLD